MADGYENVWVQTSPGSYRLDLGYEEGEGAPEGPGVHENAQSWTLALVLGAFLGALGAHRFYTGKKATGAVWLLTLGCLGVGTTVDVVRIAAGYFKAKDGTYLYRESGYFPFVWIVLCVGWRIGLHLVTALAALITFVIVNNNLGGMS